MKDKLNNLEKLYEENSIHFYVRDIPSFYARCLAKYYDNDGRAGPQEFWSFSLVNLLLFCLLLWSEMPFCTRLAEILLYVTVTPFVALVIRRLHDLNLSGWWLWLPLVVLGGNFWLAQSSVCEAFVLTVIFLSLCFFGFLLYLSFVPGDATANRYGQAPVSSFFASENQGDETK